MCAAEDAQADHIDIFLQRGFGNHLWRLAQTSVDHFHPGVTQGARNYLRAPIMTIESRFGDQHTNGFIGFHNGWCPIWRGRCCNQAHIRWKAYFAAEIKRVKSLSPYSPYYSRCGQSLGTIKTVIKPNPKHPK